MRPSRRSWVSAAFQGLSETGAVFQSAIESEIPVQPASGDHPVENVVARGPRWKLIAVVTRTAGTAVKAPHATPADGRAGRRGRIASRAGCSLTFSASRIKSAFHQESQTEKRKPHATPN